jgi:hypothetical protein
VTRKPALFEVARIVNVVTVVRDVGADELADRLERARGSIDPLE